MQYLIPLLLAFAYRARGGAVSLGDSRTNLARFLFWGIPNGLVFAFIAYKLHAPYYYAAFSALGAFFAAMVGHASEQTDGDIEHLEMGCITTVMLALTLIPFAKLVPLYIWPMGFFSAFAYWLGYKMPFGFKLFGIQWCTKGDASWGEFLTGLLAFGVPLACLTL